MESVGSARVGQHSHPRGSGGATRKDLVSHVFGGSQAEGLHTRMTAAIWSSVHRYSSSSPPAREVGGESSAERGDSVQRRLEIEGGVCGLTGVWGEVSWRLLGWGVDRRWSGLVRRARRSGGRLGRERDGCMGGCGSPLSELKQHAKSVGQYAKTVNASGRASE